MALSLGDISIGTEGLYLGNILIGPDNVKQILPPVQLFVEWIAIGGGGGGGFYGTNVDFYRGGAGGAGGIVTGSATLLEGDSISIVVGTGGTGATTSGGTTTNGADSYMTVNAITYYGKGGGGGGTGNNPSGDAIGKSGGSGGGGASLFDSSNTLIFAAAGGATTQVSTYGYGSGMAGCAGSTTAPPSVNSRGGDGGTSVNVVNTGCPFRYTPGFVWVDGGQYAIGGDAGDTTQQNLSFAGWGGNANSDGSYGTCIIRYAGGVQRADGGTVVSFGSPVYTYHFFQTPGGPYTFDNIR